ncbi:uncharacterized protein LOC100882387 isoform X2 [Megachile rotundata]|uniref:uncharacterized protein LOC100882387 isoform X2 n=1 Tax=Megachile rotundata TaxID=143995 RepID=UPI000614CCDB|nr:PREDICTED: E3 ubiquitin-protein ligase RNF13-like isoform X2 [Megachile rotundata]
MAYPGLACVLIGITVATILYYMFGNDERDAYTYERDRYRDTMRESQRENGYNSGFHRRNISHNTDFDDCTICLTPLGAGRKIVLKACNHAFHKNCIDEWKRLEQKTN